MCIFKGESFASLQILTLAYYWDNRRERQRGKKKEREINERVETPLLKIHSSKKLTELYYSASYE